MIEAEPVSTLTEQPVKKKHRGKPYSQRVEYFREWNKRRTPEMKAKKAKADAARWKRNKVVLLAQNAEYHRTHVEEIAARKEKWRRDNYDAVTSSEKKYRKSPQGRTADDNCKRRYVALKFKCEVRATAAEIQNLKDTQKICWYCGSPDRLTVDHFIPLKRGGAHAIENLVMACKSCNSRKAAMLPETFAKRSGLTFKMLP